MKRRTPQVPTTKGAKLLREWLDKTDTSQGELAELIGVGQATVSKWLGAHSPRIRHAIARRPFRRLTSFATSEVSRVCCPVLSAVCSSCR